MMVTNVSVFSRKTMRFLSQERLKWVFPVDKFSNAGIVLLRSKFFLYSQASPLRRSQVMPGQGWWMVHFGAALRGRRHRLLPLGAAAERFPEMGEKMVKQGSYERNL